MEALDSALAEARDVGGVVVIVNDGCPYEQTHALAASFAAGWPRHVCYLRTPNAGLSAARNRGIRHALARFPGIEAIYLLDADNRLHRGAMRRALATLRAHAADWVYPSIDMVGVEMNFDHSQPYSLLRLLFQNLCEAGSMVDRRVFEAGMFFDEDMKLGWEDWEFWLRCADAGFRGVCCPDLGLQYRTRRESMLRDSDRRGAELGQYIRNKHKALYAWRHLLRLEHREAPRYCMVDAGSRRFQFGSVPGEWSHSGPLEDLAEQYWRHETYPTHVHFPHYVAFGDGAILAQLAAAGLIDWVFWQAQDLLAAHAAVFVIVASHPSAIAVSTDAPAGPAAAPHLVVVAYETLRDAVLDAEGIWLASLCDPDATAKPAHVAVAGPFAPSVVGDPASLVGLETLAATVEALRVALCRPEDARAWEWREWSNIVSTRRLHVRVASEIHAAGPLARGALDDRRELAIVLPVASFGGVEQVALHVARCFREAGWTVRLVVTGANRCESAALLAGAVDTVTFLNDPATAGFNRGGATYFGHNLQAWSKSGRIERLIGLLAGSAAVIGFHSLHVNEAMGWLRRNGTVAVTSLHVIDHDDFGAPVGHPYLHLPYEHAYDIITAPSRALLRFCAGAGVPQAKLLLLENAPSFAAGGEAVQRRLTQLADEEQAAPDAARRALRVLYLGRLDRQKGVERLLGTIRATGGDGPRIVWRVIGASVVGEGREDWTTPALAALGVRPEPAIYDRAVLAERLSWADALLLPSRWEGSPLIVLEAQSLGAVPVATEVGAVDEMIVHGEDGWLVAGADDAALIAAMAEALRMLARDPALRARLSRNAMAARRGLTWERNAAPLVAEVERLAALRAR